jgi:hypothetical protein
MSSSAAEVWVSPCPHFSHVRALYHHPPLYRLKSWCQHRTNSSRAHRAGSVGSSVSTTLCACTHHPPLSACAQRHRTQPHEPLIMAEGSLPPCPHFPSHVRKPHQFTVIQAQEVCGSKGTAPTSRASSRRAVGPLRVHTLPHMCVCVQRTPLSGPRSLRLKAHRTNPTSLIGAAWPPRPLISAMCRCILSLIVIQAEAGQCTALT